MKGLNYLLVKGAQDILEHGSARVNARTGDEIKELHDYVMIGNPEQRYINIDARKNNICAQVVEMMMVLSGNPDLKYLSYFLPRAVDYSDDGGLTWRGNYGIRLRGNNVFDGENNKSFQFARYTRDNLENVINTLKIDPSSRQCFITIGDSNLDRFIETKDTPCTMTLVFGITAENTLRLTTFMRSNDIIFGFSGVNYFIFTCLQELVASILNYKLGEYCHHAVSFHVYSWKYDLIQNIADTKLDTIEEIELPTGLFRGIKTLDQFDELANFYFHRLDDENMGIGNFYQLMLSKSENVNISTLLTATYAYHHGFTRQEFDNICYDSPVFKSGLFDRDAFFHKHVK